MALKVTFVPSQINDDGLAVILILAGTLGVIVMLITFEPAGLPVGQTMLLVIIHCMRSPSANVVLE